MLTDKIIYQIEYFLGCWKTTKLNLYCYKLKFYLLNQWKNIKLHLGCVSLKKYYIYIFETSWTEDWKKANFSLISNNKVN